MHVYLSYTKTFDVAIKTLACADPEHFSMMKVPTVIWVCQERPEAYFWWFCNVNLIVVYIPLHDQITMSFLKSRGRDKRCSETAEGVWKAFFLLWFKCKKIYWWMVNDYTGFKSVCLNHVGGPRSSTAVYWPIHIVYWAINLWDFSLILFLFRIMELKLIEQI